MAKLATGQLSRIVRLSVYMGGFVFIVVLSLQSWHVTDAQRNFVAKIENEALQKLKGVVLSASARMDGNAYHELIKIAPAKDDIRESEQEAGYFTIYETLRSVANRFEVSGEVYTLISEPMPDGLYQTYYGATSRFSPRWRHPYPLPVNIHNIRFRNGYEKRIRGKNLDVLLAVVPIFTRENQVCGFVGCHSDYAPVALMADENMSRLIWQQVPVSIGFAVMLSLFVMGIRQSVFQEDEWANNIRIKLNNTYHIIEEFVENVKRGNYEKPLQLDDYKDDSLARSLNVLHGKLADNARSSTDRSWIAEGRLKIASSLRLHNDFEAMALDVVSELTDYLGAAQGAFYICDGERENMTIEMKALYAYNRKKYHVQNFRYGEGLVGQCAYERAVIYRTEIPEDYVTISSGITGDIKPSALLLVPLITNEKLHGILELAATRRFTEIEIRFAEELGDVIARSIFNLKTNIRTLELLRESQEKSEALEQQQEELRQNERKIHSLLENASEVITIYNEVGTVIYESPSVKSILGYDPNDIVGRSDFGNIHPEGLEKVQNMFAALRNHPDSLQKIEFQYQKKDGNWIWLESFGKNLVDDPAIGGIVLNSRDITERRVAEQEQIMRGKMQALSENSRDIIIRFNLQGRFLYTNPMLEQYTRIPKSRFDHALFTEIGLEESMVNHWLKILDRIRHSNQLVAEEMPFLTPEGERVMNVSAIPEMDEDGRLDTVLMVLHDITGQKQQEAIIKKANKKITDSINYARRIQSSIIPDNGLIREYFRQSFIFYRAKDVVSGDFPWLKKKGDAIFLAAVDCTGHGVPGAMMSLIGYFLLNNITDMPQDFTPAEVLTHLHEGVRTTLRQGREGAEAKDGMDVALCKINPQTMQMEYSGAHRPLYLVREGTLTQYKGTRKAIGGTVARQNKAFINHTIKLQEGDAIYFFSDGLPDQFGGPENFKYAPKRIRDKVSKSHGTDMQKLLQWFEDDFVKWKGGEKQTDDVLLIGIKF